MNHPSKIAVGLFIVSILIVTHTPQALAQTINADFQQAVADYQKSPSVDGADKVIKLAVAMDKLPAVPEEARKHFIKGGALFKDAKSSADFAQVLDEFKEASRLAPWWPEARYNLALACESAGNYPSAMANLKLYQLFKLPDAEARSVQDKIYVLEAKQEKAAKESSSQVVAAQDQKKSDDWLQKIDGRRYASPGMDGAMIVLDVRGRLLVPAVIDRNGKYQQEDQPFEVQGRVTTIPNYGNPRLLSLTYTISEDGESIKRHVPMADGPYDNIYIWQR